MIFLIIEGKHLAVEVSSGAQLLRVLKGHLKLTDTKSGWGTGICDACTGHIDGKAERSYYLTFGEVQCKWDQP